MKKLFSITGLAVALVLFLVLNILTGAALKSARLDLTENELYTLSPGTRNILANLQEPVRLRFYFSKKLASDSDAGGQVASYAQRVQELLEEYAAASRGKITLEVFDPEPFSEEEDRAVAFGLQGVPVNAGGELVYFGLAGTNTTDQEETITFFQESREEFLEYDITKLVHNLSNPKKKVVGLLTSLPMDGNPMARFTNPNAEVRAWIIVDQMRELFEVRTIATTVDQIEDGLDLLLIVHPQGLAPKTLYAIDQYALRGGKIVAFIDPHCEVQEVRQDPQNPMAAMMANRSSDLGPLLGAWGLEMPADMLAGDHDNALRVGFQNQPVDYLVWFGLHGGEKANLNQEDPVTSELDTIHVASAGILTKKDGATTTVSPLFETSANSMRIPKTDVQFGDPVRLLTSFVSGNEKLMLAARVSGPAKTAYPEGEPKQEPPPAEGETPPPPAEGEQLKESQGPINVIVVADADLLEDRFWTRTQNFLGQKIVIPNANNGDLAINAIDNMSGSTDLISLRSRGRFNRPFERVSEIRKEAEANLRQRAKALEDKLRDTEQKISELQSHKEGQGSMILSPEQQKEIVGFREEQVRTRKELRKVRHDMQKDIESLGTTLKVLNIALMPLLVVTAAIGVAALRSSRNARDIQGPTKQS